MVGLAGRHQPRRRTPDDAAARREPGRRTHHRRGAHRIHGRRAWRDRPSPQRQSLHRQLRDCLDRHCRLHFHLPRVRTGPARLHPRGPMAVRVGERRWPGRAVALLVPPARGIPARLAVRADLRGEEPASARAGIHRSSRPAGVPPPRRRGLRRHSQPAQV